ncbi:MAG TPA: amidohydrolase family protein [Anaerolineae bacterium]|nr:amidohydrolase family protein [Anaerolineae bacterium]HQH37699.1 amidohydrolase family protein [Anaerolineae bacterium]
MADQEPKHTVDKLITADFVVTMNPTYDIYTPGAVAVTGDSIVTVGPRDALTAAYVAEERLDVGNSVVMPGLINTHGHAPMTLLRALVDDLRLDVWLMGYVMPVEGSFVNANFCWTGTQLAAAEMIRSGTTTFMDMYYFEEAVADATVQAGMRAVCAQSVLKFPTPDSGSYEEGLARSRDYIVRWKGHPLIVPAIAPHAPYTVTPDLLEDAVTLALEYDVPLHIHVAETAQEVIDHRKEYGIPPVVWLKKLGVFEAKTTAAHCVHIDESEMRILQHDNVGVAHNPSSNMKLSSGIAPVAKMLELGINVGIGTDGAASNNDLDMIEEMRLASFLAKVAVMTPTVLPARQVIEMATIMGARAMHIESLTGSLEPGKRADLITVSMDDVHHMPYFRHFADSLYGRLAYAMNQEDVRNVMVNGVWLMRDRCLLTVDVEALREETALLTQKIDTFLIRREESVLSKLVAIGGVAQDKAFEVQVKVRSDDLTALELRLHASPEITFVRGSQRTQYDTYFIFDDQWDSRLRYREDEVRHLDTDELIDVIYRLTLTTMAKEREYEHSVLLSRARFDAAATRSRRFYEEYFKPKQVIEIHKTRRRYHIRYGGTDFALNLDHISKPEDGGSFLEIKSRTWSRLDAERKAALIGELLKTLRIPDEDLIRAEYVDLAG